MERVLFVDDERSVLNTLRRQLSDEPYEQFFAGGGEEALARLEQTEISVIVSDMRMPEMDGVAFLCKAKEKQPDTRRVVLTGYANLASVVSAVNDANIHAYLVKPWKLQDLKTTIDNEIEVYRKTRSEIIEKIHLQELAELSRSKIDQLQHEATTDPLTGLDNRRSFEKRLQQEWNLAQRKKYSVAIAMIDIDHFKLVNDTAGHAEGDRILAAVARCLSGSILRPGDFVARYGGEEFVAVLPDTENPELVGERFRVAVEKIGINHPGKKGLLTISVGVASAFPDKQQLEAHALIAIADKALYESKANGRNKVTYIHT